MAVTPGNVMGMSKATMERVACSHSRFDTGTTSAAFAMATSWAVAARSSRCSAALLIEEGRLITITVRRMTRFLLTLDQSVDLVKLNGVQTS